MSARWLEDNRAPDELLADLRKQLNAWAEAYIEADLEARDAGRRRARALEWMRKLRSEMIQFAAGRGLEMPPPRRWERLLEGDAE